LNIKSFSKNLAANLLAHKPEHLRPKYEKIIPTLLKLDFEDFASHVMINFPDREETYSDGNWENIARYFYPRSSQILARAGTITLTGENPILNTLYKTRFANIFIQIIFHTIIAGLLFLSAMVIYSVILKSVSARVYEVAIHRVVGLDKFDMVLMLMCNAALMTLAGVLVGILITKIAFYIVNSTALNTEKNELGFYLTFSYAGTLRSILIAMIIPQISSVLPIRDLLKGKIVDDLDKQRPKTSNLQIKIKQNDHGQRFGWTQFFAATFSILQGLVIFYFLPTAMLSLNISLFVYIFFGLLAGLITGILMILTNFSYLIESFFLLFLRLFDHKYIWNLTRINLISHRYRNRRTV
jgi:hypothetical protein